MNDKLRGIKKLNRDILKLRLSSAARRYRSRETPISNEDIMGVRIAVRSSDTFEQLFELIDLM